jgi:hypothetical protein
LRGTGTSDYITVLSFDYNSIFYWRAENTSQDITHIFRQATTNVAVHGWDDSASAYTIAIGTSFASTSRLAITNNLMRFYGANTSSIYLDAVSGVAIVYIDGSSGQDSEVLFRENGGTQFIMGHDAGTSTFQIHSSTIFSTVADFQISTAGDIGIGIAPATSYPFYMDKSHTSGTNYIMRLDHDGNNALACQGIRMQLGQDTPTASDTNHILSLDGNGTTVGALLVDSTSYRIFNAISSRNYKKNIRPMEINATELFRNPKAQPKVYNFKGRRPEDEAMLEALGELDKDMSGFVIEDLAEVFPDAVKLIDRGDGVRDLPAYADTVLIKYLVKAIAELDARLNTIEP